MAESLRLKTFTTMRSTKKNVYVKRIYSKKRSTKVGVQSKT